ncbi:variant erythrocyte surface antigen-1 family protein [Babesia caballi]|uniref:Variant erythrocyte surface antigen-1 family protein n=1 Tax=Babesia caballi TaxID=5871 RepID=A0AAV4LZ32_BABCB|nr:variant erythrocyte surface antigen-1 family protein [Babesia caballi]
MYTDLENAVTKLPGFKTATKSSLGSSSLSGFIKNLGDKLGRGFLGYGGSLSFDGDGIIKNHQGYTSKYHNATWEQHNASEYAKIFLLLAILVYYFITFLYWACKDKWKRKQLQYSSTSSLFYLFNALGYAHSQLNEKRNGSHIAERLGGHDGFDELSKAYGSDSTSASYDSFLQQLEKTCPRKKIDAPLTNSNILCYAYLQSKQSDTGITDAINAIQTELERLSTSLTSGSTSSSHSFSKLTGYISTLLTKIKSFDPNGGSSGSGSSEPGSDGLQKAGSSGTGSTPHTTASSPAGPAVGGLLGVGTLGAGAAYGLNLGGLQTTINGLLHLR